MGQRGLWVEYSTPCGRWVAGFLRAPRPSIVPRSMECGCAKLDGQRQTNLQRTERVNPMRLSAAFALIAVSILLAAVFPSSAFWLACVLCLASLRWERTLVATFFFFAALHCVLGYFVSFKGEGAIYWLTTGYDMWFSQAAFAIALGLFSMATAYGFANRSKPTWINGLSIDENHLRNVTRVAVLIAACLMFYMYAGFSVIDLAMQNIADVGKLRYLGSETATDAYLVVRVSDALVCTLPLLWIMRQKKLDYFIYSIGLVALLLPLRRAAIFSVLFVPLLVRSKAINYRKVGIVVLAFLVLLAASQIALLSFTENDATSSLASALSEVRDLGWVMELMHGNYLQGSTLIQPFDPFPGIIDTWKNTHSIAYFTADLLNVDPESRSFGGLRLTLAGEAFMNFWFFGPVFCGFLLGLCASWAERAMKNSTTLPIRYLSVTALVWICLWLYMGGTQAVATLKFELIVLSIVYFLSRKRSVPASLTSLQPALQ